MTFRGEWRPGVIEGVLAKATVTAEQSSVRALTQLALAIERKAVENASQGSHPRGTPTPASRGGGPAVISGTLRRAITHTPVEGNLATELSCMVGMAAGYSSPYSDTPASRYASYLEHVWDYPFLGPAFDFGVHTAGPLLFAESFRFW